MRKNVLEYLESSARMHADKPAFCDENRVFTFGELLKAAQVWARTLPEPSIHCTIRSRF